MTGIGKITHAFQILFQARRITEHVITAGRYESKSKHVTEKNFPIREIGEGLRDIVYLEFNSGTYVTSKEVLKEAQRQGLERPLYEDALFFGEQYPEEQRKDPVVFLHEPWRRWWLGKLLVLVLQCHMCGKRAISLICFSEKWPSHCRFAFIRPTR